MEEKKQKINMNIGDASSDFFAHEASINFNQPIKIQKRF